MREALFVLLFAICWMPLALLGFAWIQRRADKKRIKEEQAFIRDMNNLRRLRNAHLGHGDDAA